MFHVRSEETLGRKKKKEKKRKNRNLMPTAGSPQGTILDYVPANHLLPSCNSGLKVVRLS